MKKIAIVSDTHGMFLDETAKLILENKCEYIIFLGDFYLDGPVLQEKTSLECVSVLGNNDYKIYDKYEDEALVEINGYKIFACHGHKYKVEEDLKRLQEKAKRENFDICLFGHTHVYQHEVIDGVHYFNPGSPTIAKYNYDPTSFAIMDLSDGVKFEKIILAPPISERKIK